MRIRAVMDDWEVPPEMRRDTVKSLHHLTQNGESDRERVRACEALIKLGVDKVHENIDREREYEQSQREQAKLELLQGGGGQLIEAILKADVIVKQQHQLSGEPSGDLPEQPDPVQ
jgi:hypothetical protein